jgi:hypothetical protein
MSVRRMALLLAAVAMMVTVAVPAQGSGSLVTSGTFVTLPGGADLGYTIEGRAVMVRTPADGGQTWVMVWARGLDPATTYPAHVHNLPCSATPPGGSHYQHEVGGPVDAVNEIWPAITTNAAGVGRGKASHGHWAGDDARSIVIHYPPDTSIRLACVDLT